MKTKSIQVMFVAATCTMLALPAYARGGFGGFGGGRGGGGFGGFHSGGGGGFGGFHSSGGSFGGGGREFGGGGFGGRQPSTRDFGGGFNSMGNHGGSFGGGQGFENRGGQGFENRGNFGGGGQGFQNRGNFGGGNHPDQPISSRPNFPDHQPTDGGFGGISGLQNRTPHNINQNNLNNQGKNIRNSFNNNNISHNNQFNQQNNYNVNRYGGYGGYGHYGGYGAGYAHGWANSNAYHGYWGAPGCWGYPGWSEAGMWTCMGLTSLTAFLGMGMMGAAMAGGSGKNSAPASTTNVTYQGDTVYVNGQPAGTSAQYYQQAQQLAAQAYAQGQADAYNSYNSQQNNGSYPPLAPELTGAANASAGQASDWAPLGVFALAEPGQQQSNMMLQLAINKNGTVRGNYLNQLTNERSQVYGSLDKSTQRVSWTIGQNNSTVFDTTIGDLTKEDSQVLVHYGPNNTQEMALIRLQQPADGGQDGGADQGSSPAPGA